MKIVLTFFFCLFAYVSAMAAHQYNVKGNQGWLTFDGSTTVSFDLSRSGKDEGKTQENSDCRPTFSMAKSAKISKYNVWIPIVSALLIWLMGVSPVYIIALAGIGGFIFGKLKTHNS